MTNDELIARLEAATAEQQRELLIEAYDAVFPCAREPAAKWKARTERFMRMLDAEAYESAALTLVDLRRFTLSLSIGALNLAFLTQMIDDPLSEPPCFEGTGSTPALAICIAAIKAKEAHRA